MRNTYGHDMGVVVALLVVKLDLDSNVSNNYFSFLQPPHPHTPFLLNLFGFLSTSQVFSRR